MLRNTIIAAAFIVLTPAIAFAAPAPTTLKAKPAVTHTVKAEKVKVIKARHHVMKTKVAAHVRAKAKTKVNKI